MVSGTLSGMLLVMVVNIDAGDLVRTVVLSFVGAAVSFLVSWGLKWVARKLKI
jgi:hypothetical protein